MRYAVVILDDEGYSTLRLYNDDAASATKALRVVSPAAAGNPDEGV